MTATEELNGHQIRSERSTRALIRAAGDLIAEGGYQSMTLAAVGERAGHSRSLATARFGSKAKLLEALVDQIVVRWNVERVAPGAKDLNGLESLRVLLTEVRDSYERDPRSMRILYALFFEALGPVPELHERFVTFHRNYRDQIASLIRQGIDDGSIRAGIDPELEAIGIVAQLRGFGYLWSLDPESIEPKPVLTLMIEQCLRALPPDPGTKLSRPRRSARSRTTASG